MRSSSSNHNCSAWGSHFNPPPSSQSSILTQQQEPAAAVPSRPIKAKSRRKRHIPPGPAGVWFQAMSLQQQQQNASSSSWSHHGVDHNHDMEDDDPMHARLHGGIKRNNHKASATNATAATDVTTCPAWMLMQLQMPKLLTPHLPPYATIAQRHTALRSFFCIPPLQNTTPTPTPTPARTDEDNQNHNLIFLPDLMMEPSSLVIPKNKQLIVLVHAVHSSNSYCDWTVELQDETGSVMHAWMAPQFVKKESDRPLDKLRVGVVWMMSNITLLPSIATNISNNNNNNNHDSNRKWLLIRESNISKYWIPPKNIPHDIYLQWMSKRNAIPNSFIVPEPPSPSEGHDNEEEQEEREMEIDSPIFPTTTTNRHSNRETTSATTTTNHDEEEILPADFGLQVLPSLHPPSLSSHRFTTTAVAPTPQAAQRAAEHYENENETPAGASTSSCTTTTRTRTTIATPATNNSTLFGTTPPTGVTPASSTISGMTPPSAGLIPLRPSQHHTSNTTTKTMTITTPPLCPPQQRHTNSQQPYVSNATTTFTEKNATTNPYNRNAVSTTTPTQATFVEPHKDATITNPYHVRPRHVNNTQLSQNEQERNQQQQQQQQQYKQVDELQSFRHQAKAPSQDGFSQRSRNNRVPVQAPTPPTIPTTTPPLKPFYTATEQESSFSSSSQKQYHNDDENDYLLSQQQRSSQQPSPYGSKRVSDDIIKKSADKTAVTTTAASQNKKKKMKSTIDSTNFLEQFAATTKKKHQPPPPPQQQDRQHVVNKEIPGIIRPSTAAAAASVVVVAKTNPPSPIQKSSRKIKKKQKQNTTATTTTFSNETMHWSTSAEMMSLFDDDDNDDDDVHMTNNDNKTVNQENNHANTKVYAPTHVVPLRQQQLESSILNNDHPNKDHHNMNPKKPAPFLDLPPIGASKSSTNAMDMMMELFHDDDDDLQ